MIFVQGSIEANEADITRITPLLQEMAAQSNQEDGCLHYSFAIDVARPSLLRINERWKSEDDLNAHFQTEHMAKFNAAVATVSIQSMDVRMYSGDEVKVMMQS